MLDVGTGTGKAIFFALGAEFACMLTVVGAWVREMALEYPNADFIGVDVVQVPPPASLIDKSDGVLSSAIVRSVIAS